MSLEMDEGQLCPPSRDLALPRLLTAPSEASLHTLTQNPTKTPTLVPLEEDVTTIFSSLFVSRLHPSVPSLAYPRLHESSSPAVTARPVLTWLSRFLAVVSLPFPSPFVTRRSSHFILWLDEPRAASPRGSATLIPILPPVPPFVSLDALQSHE